MNIMEQKQSDASKHDQQKQQQAAPNKQSKDTQQATAGSPAHDHDDLLSLLLGQTHITWNQAAVCRLLCTSKSVHEKVCQQLSGQVSADFGPRVTSFKEKLSANHWRIHNRPPAATWLSKHASLLGDLHLDLPRVDETRPGWGGSCGWGCGCCSDQDGNMEVLDTNAEAALAAALAVEEAAVPAPEDAAARDDTNAKNAEGSSSSLTDNEDDDSDVGAFESEDSAFISDDEYDDLAQCIRRPNAVHLRSFSTTTPAPRVLAVLPSASLTRLELTFHQDDVLCEDRFLRQVSRQIMGLANLQTLILNMANFPDKNAMNLTEAFDAVLRALRELHQLKHLHLGQLSRLCGLQQLPPQLTSLTVGLRDAWSARRAQQRQQQPHNLHMSWAEQQRLWQQQEHLLPPEVRLGHLTALQHLTISDLKMIPPYADDGAGRRDMALYDGSKILHSPDDALPPHIKTLHIGCGGAIQPLLRLQQLQQLTISDCTMCAGDLQQLALLTSLQTFELSHASLATAAAAAAAPAWGLLPQLRSLSLNLAAASSTKYRVDQQEQQQRQQQYQQQRQQTLMELAGLTSLTRLQISGLTSSSAEMSSLLGGRHLPRLRELFLVNFTAAEGEVRCQHLQEATQLTLLELQVAGGCRLNTGAVCGIVRALPGLATFVMKP